MGKLFFFGVEVQDTNGECFIFLDFFVTFDQDINGESYFFGENSKKMTHFKILLLISLTPPIISGKS